MAESLEVPRALLDRARAFVASGAEPAPTRSAATVVLLRERPGKPFEVYVIRRVAAMAFGGNYAFPGGGVDPSDAGVRLDWVGPTAAEWARWLDTIHYEVVTGVHGNRVTRTYTGAAA